MEVTALLLSRLQFAFTISFHIIFPYSLTITAPIGRSIGASTPWAKELPSPTSHSNRSLRTEVSVAGKRNFEGRDKEAETALEIQGRRCRDKISLGNPANSGLIAGFREISVRTRMRGRAEDSNCVPSTQSLSNRSLASDPPTAILRSNVAERQHIQKGLAFGRHWSGTVR